MHKHVPLIKVPPLKHSRRFVSFSFDILADNKALVRIEMNMSFNNISGVSTETEKHYKLASNNPRARGHIQIFSTVTNTDISKTKYILSSYLMRNT